MSQDPTKIRLSDTFLLSDFIRADTLFRRKGYGIDVVNFDGIVKRNGTLLAETLEEMQELFGPISISYGFITNEYSLKTVRWKAPHLPSYHKWDDGASADVCFFDRLSSSKPPIYTAHDIDSEFNYSRLITYAESPYICVGVNALEHDSGSHRLAFYENRYVHKCDKPVHIKYPNFNRGQFKSSVRNEIDYKNWAGNGYPTMHSLKIRQFQHVRLSKYHTLIDFLYMPEKVAYGIPNAPINSNIIERKLVINTLKEAAKALDRVVIYLKHKTSIVRSFNTEDKDWNRRYSFTIIPPMNVKSDDLAHVLSSHDTIKSVYPGKGTLFAISHYLY